MRVPSAVYSGRSASRPYRCSTAVARRTGPQPAAIDFWYRSSVRCSFSTDRLMTWNVMSTGRTFSTSSSQREVIQAHGHLGSNHIWAIVRGAATGVVI